MKASQLNKACKRFNKQEKRSVYYSLASEIVKAHPLQAAIIILASWNVGRYRYYFKRKQIKELRETIRYCMPLFRKIENKKLESVDYDSVSETISEIYKRLSAIKGVEYTGASKVMHLINQNLFVMGDSYIRKKGYCMRANETAAGDYIEFLKKVQNKFRNVKWSRTDRTLAKAIDEYNYVRYTLPELRKKQRTRN